LRDYHRGRFQRSVDGIWMLTYLSPIGNGGARRDPTMVVP
jgi:hypothetical protein